MNNLIKTAIIAIFTLFITIKNSDANMFNKFKDGFYFEKYSSADEAKAALLELHPIGSDVEGLIKFLERLEIKCDTKFNKNEYGIFLNCRYKESGPFYYLWTLSVRIHEQNKIAEFYIGKALEVL